MQNLSNSAEEHMASAHFLLCRHDMSAALTVIASIDWSCEHCKACAQASLV